MPLKKTKALIKEFGSELINGTITDERLRELAKSSLFNASEGYVDPNQPVSDTNCTKLNIMQDFVLMMGPELAPDTLHSIIERLLKFNDEEDNTFLRNNSLEKVFLTYEMATNPDEANKHFEQGGFIEQKNFNGREKQSLKETILSPGILHFKKEIENANQLKLEQLQQLCTHYQQHLKKSVGEENLVGDSLATQKHNLVDNMQTILMNQEIDPTERIEQVKTSLTQENKNILKAHRDPVWMQFLSGLLHVLTGAISSKIQKDTFQFWKSHGEVLVDELESKITPPSR